mmetsp:Transcript_43629/g.100629  ORF Transcript_43629/g.100629 Transcript_43629/m.100629 type:complete len:219 (+) Transcript_43629:430-1086(+)
MCEAWVSSEVRMWLHGCNNAILCEQVANWAQPLLGVALIATECSLPDRIQNARTKVRSCLSMLAAVACLPLPIFILHDFLACRPRLRRSLQHRPDENLQWAAWQRCPTHRRPEAGCRVGNCDCLLHVRYRPDFWSVGKMAISEHVHHDTKRPYVSLLIIGAIQKHLGRHEWCSAIQVCHRDSVHQDGRKTKVSQLQPPSPVHEEVLWLDIPVCNSDCM